MTKQKKKRICSISVHSPIPIIRTKNAFAKNQNFTIEKEEIKLLSIYPKIPHTKSSNQKISELKLQNLSHKLQVNEIKEVLQGMRVIVKPSLHLPNKSPLKEVRIRHEIFYSDLMLASSI